MQNLPILTSMRMSPTPSRLWPVQDLYAAVNKSVTASLRSLAAHMHDHHLNPVPAPQDEPSSHERPAARTHAPPGSAHLGHTHAASATAAAAAASLAQEARAAQEAPYEAPRWLAGREKVAGRAQRDGELLALEPMRVHPSDTLPAAAYRAAMQRHLGFRLAVRRSGIMHEHAGDGVWLEGVADIGTVVAVQPGVVYTQAFHMCAPHSACMQPGSPADGLRWPRYGFA
jgi:hypothetical protein